MSASIARYLEKITSEHRGSPNYVTFISIFLQVLADIRDLTLSLPALFDIDTAVGAQLDVVGQWVGRDRFVQIPNVYFTLDDPNLGLGSGWLKQPHDTDTYLTRLDDDHYRILLYAIVALNNWDGSIEQAYEIWDTLFGGVPKILLQDAGHMTMFQAILPGAAALDPITLALFTNGEITIKPEGVRLEYLIVQPLPGTPLFGLGVHNDSIAGLGTGAFGTETRGP